MSTNGTGLTLLHFFGTGTDGALPIGLVQGPNGTLYGITTQGGATNEGTLYGLNLGGGNYSVLYNFTAANGSLPMGTLASGAFSDTGGVLYGTTTGGGPFLSGMAFSLLLDPPLYITPMTSPSPAGSSTNGQTAIFWPAWAQNYVLQSSTNLSSTNWSTVNLSNTVQVIGAQVTNSAPGTYYRLAFP